MREGPRLENGSRQPERAKSGAALGILQNSVEVAQHQRSGSTCFLVALKAGTKEVQEVGRGRASPIHRTIEMKDHNGTTARGKEERKLQAGGEVVLQPLRQGEVG